MNHEFLLGQENSIQAIMNSSPWIHPSEPSDVIDAVHRLVPCGCSKPLIRLGGDGDGAYLVPDDLEGIDACFSPGVSTTMKFEEHLAVDYGIVSYMCDASADPSKLPLRNGYHHFSRKWLGAFDNGSTQSLDTWVSESPHGNSSNLLLQMDIEGAEYGCLMASSMSVLRKFQIIVIEFHGLGSLSQRRFLNMQFLPVISKLEQIFDLIHIHPNNCCGTTLVHGVEIPNVAELTFYRKSSNMGQHFSSSTPHPLDIVNVRGNLPILLRAPWR